MLCINNHPVACMQSSKKMMFIDKLLCLTKKVQTRSKTKRLIAGVRVFVRLVIFERTDTLLGSNLQSHFIQIENSLFSVLNVNLTHAPIAIAMQHASIKST